MAHSTKCTILSQIRKETNMPIPSVHWDTSGFDCMTGTGNSAIRLIRNKFHARDAICNDKKHEVAGVSQHFAAFLWHRTVADCDMTKIVQHNSAFHWKVL